ncbi:phenylalanine--tRNA ligase beta subunit-related protein [uncultured Limosilactobacillus sp.]|uniref:B3/B4 domain-containing protein n=1 Tax=uncultured Limosilactobacillus sp. TaxID=2837629 RepID=UPI0025F83DB7|nr:phenylalanine--tRNA ligase beta subunit-related protein [uncultured Limosilactobacillus sp.]
MQQVVIDDSFWQLFPDAQVNILYVNGIDNHSSDANLAERQELLKNATAAAGEFLTNDTFRLNPVVAQWRKAFQQFKKKKGARSSIEALLKRANQGREFSPIDPLVDVYNSVSLTYGVPVGIEDREKIAGDMHLGQVKAGLSFQPVGADKDEPTLDGEVAYYDDQGAVCRCLNWRDAQRTMLTEDSTNIVAVMEAVAPAQIERANQAMAELSQLINHYFTAKQSQVFHLTKDQPAAVVPKELQ